MALLEQTGQLVVVRCWCGLQHAVPESLHDAQLRQFNDDKPMTAIYCPLGHTWYPAGETKAAQLQNQLQQEQARTHRERAAHDQTRAELQTTERRRRAEKGAKTRLQKRVANGVCPCCKRTFQNLQRHMDAKHPEYGSSP